MNLRVLCRTHLTMGAFNYKRLLMQVKLTAIIILIACVQVNATGYAQNVSFSGTNVSLKKVFSEIKKQTGYTVFCNYKMLKNANPVTVTVKNAPLEQLLLLSLHNQQLTYSIVGKTIVIEPQKEVAQKEIIPEKVLPPPVEIKGRVTDKAGHPLQGVSITVAGQPGGTTTDADGRFTLHVPDGQNAALEITSIGFVSKKISVGAQKDITIILEPEVTGLDDIVVVGYGTQKKTDLTGSVASVNGKDLVKSSATNVTNSLAGRLPGITAVNGNGKPGSGSQITIRGTSTFGDNSALVVVDGIVRSFEQIDPNEIESVSILKDASATAVYGSRAANGVILVTTKRGRSGKPTISYNGFAGIQNPTAYPKLMNGLQYATTKNVARQNMGLQPAFSAQEMEDIQQGKKAEIDWYDLTLNKKAFQTNQNISVSGGTEMVKYFMAAGYLDQEGLYDNLNYKRYSVRSNVDASINKNLTVSIDLDASRRNSNGSSYSPEAIFSDIMAAYPFDRTYNPDGTIFYTREQHPVEEIKTGYQKNVTDVLQATLSLKHELPFVKGLSVSGKASFGKEGFTSKFYQVPILMNRQDADGNTLEIYPFGGWNGKTALTESYSDYNTTTLNASLNYLASFGEHDVKAIALFEQFDAKSKNFYGFRTNFPANGLDELLYGGQVQKDANGSSFNDGRRSYVARVDYAFKNRYLLEGSFRSDGSVAFPASKKYGFFPAVSAGWKISEEAFFRNSSSLDFFDNLKLRASYGLVGNDRNVYAGRVPTFQYQQVYNLSSTIISGSNAYASVSPGILPNPIVTWESASILDVGLDGSFWNRMLQFEIDYFYKRTSNILLSRIRSIPGTIGAALPAENYAKVDNKGIELSLSHQNTIGAVNYFVKANASFAKSKVILLDEPANIPDYLLQTGRPLGFIVGYKALGFFQSDEEVQSYFPQFNGGQKAGDVKYADINGDKKIDANDRTIISMDNGVPKILGGLMIGGSYKGFDLSILFQGATKMKKMLNGRSKIFFNGGSHNNFADLLDYWTPENPNAKYPRPWENQHPNNSLESSLYLRDASYIRLKSIDFGYTFSKGISRKIGAELMRVYFSGANIFLFDKMNMFDPEVENTDGAYYPQQRTLNLGINLTF
ncbi:TonB-dependent receptor [Agriterribacter sp.]|uniref:SusC/RagA family TonB-linked outer membrane protein n=1 Tax=Agriterribacter sp. TaxID=2821509 RepID=UPI002BD7B7BB|nr:TonB-dependent receptor [Agriterribacter sp.]HTN05891.1 TonB-dependent receptor [Agriterribacter sp.]